MAERTAYVKVRTLPERAPVEYDGARWQVWSPADGATGIPRSRSSSADRPMKNAPGVGLRRAVNAVAPASELIVRRKETR